MQRIVLQSAAKSPIALIADFASRLVNRSETLAPNEHLAFTQALVLSHQAKRIPAAIRPARSSTRSYGSSGSGRRSPRLACDQQPKDKAHPCPEAGSSGSSSFGATLMRNFEGSAQASEAELKVALDTLVDRTEGLLLTDLAAIGKLPNWDAMKRSMCRESAKRSGATRSV